MLEQLTKKIKEIDSKLAALYIKRKELGEKLLELLAVPAPAVAKPVKAPKKTKAASKVQEPAPSTTDTKKSEVKQEAPAPSDSFVNTVMSRRRRVDVVRPARTVEQTAEAIKFVINAWMRDRKLKKPTINDTLLTEEQLRSMINAHVKQIPQKGDNIKEYPDGPTHIEKTITEAIDNLRATHFMRKCTKQERKGMFMLTKEGLESLTFHPRRTDKPEGGETCAS